MIMSNEINVLICLFIFSISVFIRWLSSRKLRVDFDTYGHLYYIKELSRIRATPWSDIKIQCWSGENFSHPFFLHWLLSFLPQEALLKNQRLVNIIMDSLFVVSIFIVSKYILRSLELSVLVILIYTFTPVIFTKTAMGPRMNNFSPRLFTEILFNLLAFVMLNFFDLTSLEYFICLVLLVSSILFTSKFGVQVIFFILPIYSFVAKDFYPILAIFISLLFLIIISRGKVLFQLKRQFIHLYEYFIYNNSVKNPNRDKNKFLIPKLKHLTNPLEVKSFLRNYLFYNSYTIVLIKFPIFIIYISLLVLNIFGSTNKFYLDDSTILILITTSVFLFTSLKNFLFLGESERYLNHIVAIIIIATIKNLELNGRLDFAYFIVLYGIIFWLVELFLFHKFTNNDNRALADIEIEEVLQKNEHSRVVLSIPYHNFSVYRLMLNTKHFSIFPYHMTHEVRAKFNLNFEYKYPFLDVKKLSEIVDFTNCSCVILDVNSISKDVFSRINLSSDWHEVHLNHSVYRFFLKN
jgi:hypothetical protein